MEYHKHLYLVLHPNHSLVGSQLEPEQFARHYLTGSTRHYPGRLVFAEIDLEFRNDYLRIEWGLNDLVPHEDGTPKRTKFISSYRALEHIDFQAIHRLYLASPEGYVMGLDPGDYTEGGDTGRLRVLAEIDPVRMVVLTSMNLEDYATYITDPENSKGAPKIVYSELDLDVDEFLTSFKNNPFLPPPIPQLHPSKLRDAIVECRLDPTKRTKGLSFSSDLDSIGYRRLRHGFMFAGRDGNRFFPLPTPEEIERRDLKFFRSM